MYEQREKPKKSKQQAIKYNVTNKASHWEREDNFLGCRGNRLLQRSQVGLRNHTFFNDFQPQCHLLQRVSHDEGDAKAVSILADGRALDETDKLDDTEKTTVSFNSHDAVENAGTIQVEGAVSDKTGSINPDLAKRLYDYRNWKSGNFLSEKPSLKEFQLFDDSFSVKSDFKTYTNNEWPPNFGSLDEEALFTLLPGTKIDRFGSDYGSFLSPVPTSYSERALRPGTLRAPYSVFEVTKPIEVNVATIAPWFGEVGMGTQYRLQGKAIVKDLLGNELKEVYRGPFNGYNK